MITLYQPGVPIHRQITVYSFQQLIGATRPGDTVILEGCPPLLDQLVIPHSLILVSNVPLMGQFRLNAGDTIQPHTSIRPLIIEGQAKYV
jgi:hypothetical protein